ncbi:MAG: HIT family protein [Chloroflexaceae bacterium]
MASIFSRIVQGEIPAAKIYEDDQTLAFLDINPATRGHALVICKEEYPDLLSVPPDLLAAVVQTTQKVARAITEALKPDGYNVMQNNGSAAGQEVFHYHVHIVPRWEGDNAVRAWKQGTADTQELQELATLISQQVQSVQ